MTGVVDCGSGVCPLSQGECGVVMEKRSSEWVEMVKKVRMRRVVRNEGMAKLMGMGRKGVVACWDWDWDWDWVS